MIGSSLKCFLGDKKILLLALIPFLVGVALYYFLGSWMLGDFYELLKVSVAERLNMDPDGFLSYLILAGLGVVIFFGINWGFVLIVSIIASPFNDLIVQRVKKKLNIPTEGDEGFFSRFFGVIANEMKKIGFILFLGLIAFVLGVIFPPVGMIITFWLLTISFVDYAWSLEGLSFRDCMKDFKKNFLSYTFYGGLFSLLMSIPVINIIVLPFGVTHYSYKYYSGRISG